MDLETFVETDANDIQWTRAVPKGHAAAAAFKATQEAGKHAQGLSTAYAEGTGEALKYDPKLPAALRNFAEGGRSLHMPYRRHQLTLLLKDCFLNPEHRTMVIACVSPTATDIEHSWRTLQQVSQMRGAEADVMRETKVECMRTVAEAANLLPFRRWSGARVREWLASLDDPALAMVAGTLPSNVDGKTLLSWPCSRLQHQACGGEAALAQALYGAIRAESAKMDGVANDRRHRLRGLAGRADTYKPKSMQPKVHEDENRLDNSGVLP